jgi:hypothetical protein
MTTEKIPAVAIPAFAHPVYPETLTVSAPTAWHSRIRALSGAVTYGPDYRRETLFHLHALSRHALHGDLEEAMESLVRAEKAIR